jgi:hypothetical protein
MRQNERGAIIIHVAIALIGLLCFAGIVIDQGVFYVSRRQAQSAADAGALAGALTLQTDRSAHSDAAIAAKAFANENAVWGQAAGNANIDVTSPIVCPDGTNSCIRVDVLRGALGRDRAVHTNTIPTLMMGIVGLSQQGVRATATAQVAAGNSVECIKPWVVADKWIDNSATGSNTTAWDQEDNWDAGVDSYTAPGFKATGTGNDYGLELALKEGATGTWSSGWTMEIDLGSHGSNDYRDEIAGCPTWVPTVGLYNSSTPCNAKSDENPAKGCLGVKTGMSQGPTTQGVGDLIALDPSATWNSGTNSVQGGCIASNTCSNPTHANVSPRVVPIAIFNTQVYAASGCSGTNCVAQVTNILGFFVEGMCDDVYPHGTAPAWCGSHPNKVVLGRLIDYPGQFSGSAGPAGPADFLTITRLVR